VKVISVINYKGGVGKTTLTANLGAELAARGQRVLLMDIDPQISLTLSFYRPAEWQHGLRENGTILRWFDAVAGNRKARLGDLIATPPRVEEAIGQRGRLDLIPGHFRLLHEDIRQRGRVGGARGIDETRRRMVSLSRQLAVALCEPAFEDYDVVLIDCPPNFGIATRMALIASDCTVTPTRPDYLSTIGLRYFFESYDRVISEHNREILALGESDHDPQLHPIFLGVVFTMVRFLSGQPVRQHHMVIQQARAEELPVFDTVLRYNAALYDEAGEGGIPVALGSGGNPEVLANIQDLTTEFHKRLTNDEGVRL
jgi:chromosome partitioning protein